MFVLGMGMLSVLWVTLPHVYPSTRTIQLLSDVNIVRNTCLENDLAFSMENVISQFQCAGICLGDQDCMSIVFSAENNRCDGCKSLYEEASNDSLNNTVALYFKVSCPKEWYLFQTHCYFFGDEELLYTEARDMCSATSSTLVQVDSVAENTFLVNTMLSLPAPAIGYWNDLYQFGANGVSERWRTSNDPLDQSVVVWSIGNPNDQGGTQKCHTFRVLAGYSLDDIECEERADRYFRAICEKPLK